MNKKVLIVDDEENVLSALKRSLRTLFHIETAPGASEGLERISSHGPFAVVVSDLRMPGMDGIQFLAQVREISPDTIRIMLTGHADLENAIQAVNEGNIFRFLTKPCDNNILVQVLSQGLEQFRLVTAEKELLEKTLQGSINVLTELLSLVNPLVFGRSSRIRHYMKEIAARLHIADTWQIETAGMLSQMGCVTLPEKTVQKLCQGEKLTAQESELASHHPEVAANLLGQIPRMQEVAEIIAFQQKLFSGQGFPQGHRRGSDIPLGARILKAVLDFDYLESKGLSRGRVFNLLKNRSGWYDPQILNVMESVLGDEPEIHTNAVSLDQLQTHMILVEDIMTAKGILLIRKDEELTPLHLEKLKNFARTVGIKEPIKVKIPVQNLEN